MLTFDTLDPEIKSAFNGGHAIGITFVKKDGTIKYVNASKFRKAYEKSGATKTDAQLNVNTNNNLLTYVDNNKYNAALIAHGGDRQAAANDRIWGNVIIGNILAVSYKGKVKDYRGPEYNQIKERYGDEIYNAINKNQLNRLQQDIDSTNQEINKENAPINEHVNRMCTILEYIDAATNQSVDGMYEENEENTDNSYVENEDGSMIIRFDGKEEQFFFKSSDDDLQYKTSTKGELTYESESGYVATFSAYSQTGDPTDPQWDIVDLLYVGPPEKGSDDYTIDDIGGTPEDTKYSYLKGTNSDVYEGKNKTKKFIITEAQISRLKLTVKK